MQEKLLEVNVYQIRKGEEVTGIMVVVDPEMLEAAAKQIEKNKDDYKKAYEDLYNQVSAMGNVWEGADNAAFTNQINGFSDDFRKMSTLLGQLSDFLRKSAREYSSAQNDAIVKAKALLT